VFFLRFNPDAFATGSKSSRVKVRAESVAQRHEVVLKQLKDAFEMVRPSGMTFVKLFYDCKCVEDCGYTHTDRYEDHEAFLKAFQ
jgi:hypothetical protein